MPNNYLQSLTPEQMAELQRTGEANFNGIRYNPIYGSSGSGEGGDYAAPAIQGYTSLDTSQNPNGVYQDYDPTGKYTGTHTGEEASWFNKAMPYAILAAGGAAGAGLLGGAEAGLAGAGEAGLGGEGFLPIGGSAGTSLTPAAIESGLGTAGYGANAGALASGAFDPALIGAGAGVGASGLANAASGAASGAGSTSAGLAGAVGTTAGTAGAAGAGSTLANAANAARVIGGAGALAGAVGAAGAGSNSAGTGTAATGGQSLIDLANTTAANNLAMAKYTTNANRFNQTNQYGSSNWVYTPQYDANGKETGGGWTQTTTLNPAQQALFNSQTAGNQGLSDTANTALRNSTQLANPNLDLSKLPGYKGIDLNTLPAAAITPGTTAYNAMMARLQPQLSQQENALSQRLANQGITLGSEAYNREMNLAGQNRNDLQLQAAAQGISLDQAARQQALGEQQAQSQNIMSQRGQMLNEQTASINTPLNTINALRSGSQVQQPQFQNLNAQQANVAGADVLGAGQAQQANALNASNASKAQNAGIFGGLAQLGTAAMMAPTGTFSGLFG